MATLNYGNRNSKSSHEKKVSALFINEFKIFNIIKNSKSGNDKYVDSCKK